MVVSTSAEVAPLAEDGVGCAGGLEARTTGEGRLSEHWTDGRCTPTAGAPRVVVGMTVITGGCEKLMTIGGVTFGCFWVTVATVGDLLDDPNIAAGSGRTRFLASAYSSAEIALSAFLAAVSATNVPQTVFAPSSGRIWTE